MSSIKNYTTQISCEKTISEINRILSRHGVDKIMMDYDGGEPVSLVFRITESGHEMSFQLPCRWEATLRKLKNDGVAKKLQTKEQALRVSWRIIKDWVDSQMALVSLEMVEVKEIFLPYALVRGGGTVYESMVKKGFNLLSE